jgi:acyl carrier protein
MVRDTADAGDIAGQIVDLVVTLAPHRVDRPVDTLRLVEDLGYDSLGLVELAVAIEEHLGVEIDSETSFTATTVGDVRELIHRLVQEASP